MLAELKKDLERLPGKGLARLVVALQTPGFYATALHRLGNDIYTRWPRAAAVPAKLVYKPVASVAGWAMGIYLAPTAKIGPGLYIGHWGGIRVGPTAVLGENCNLSPGVIVGFGIKDGVRGEPVLGDRVYVAAGAKVFGPIKVGSDVAVGANAVVCRDVPTHVSVGGVPARVISQRGSGDYIQVGQQLGTRVERPPRNEMVIEVPPMAAVPPGLAAVEPAVTPADAGGTRNEIVVLPTAAEPSEPPRAE
jgi:serine O-acetyltransferase